MMLNDFIHTNQLRPADAIVVKKDNIGLLDHYLIYMGRIGEEHKFMANFIHGTKILKDWEINNFSMSFIPDRIRRFKGNQFQRETAVSRAWSRKDQASYHHIRNNCEHFANYAQYGTSYSKQTTVFGSGLALTGMATAATAKTQGGRNIGILMTVLGLLALATNNNND